MYVYINEVAISLFMQTRDEKKYSCGSHHVTFSFYIVNVIFRIKKIIFFIQTYYLLKIS